MRVPKLLLAVVALAVGNHVVVAQNTSDVSSFVNLFIGTTAGGHVFPGATLPHGMAKVGIDVDTAPRQAGYIADNSSVTGISLLHDEGTGGNTNGGYGVFPLFPLSDCALEACPVQLDARKAKRAAGKDGEGLISP